MSDPPVLDAVPPASAAPLRSVFPPVRTVAFGAPFHWLALGWRDLRDAPVASLFYGTVFALMGWVIHLVFRHLVELTSALTCGFLLLGPFLATGLYDISRRRQRGQSPALRGTLTAWRANPGAFSLLALCLTVIMLVWARASLVTFALFFSSGMPTLQNFFGQLFSADHVDFLLAYFAVGAVFASIVFAVSVVSVPMMLDRGTDTVVAALTSVRALLANPGPLGLWAALIVLIVGLGFATLFIGLVIAVPWIGHATWHAYQALVGDDPGRAD